MASTRRISFIAGMAATAALVLAPAASAAVTCTLSSGTLDVSISAGSTQASIQRGTGGSADDINVFDGGFNGTLQPCTGSPTVNNTDSVVIVDGVPSQGTFVNVGLQNGAFGPGLTPEITGTSEIEITFDAGDGSTDRMLVFGGANPDVYTFGASGAAVTGNLNGDNDRDDVTVNQGEQLWMDGGAGNDDLGAAGGTGFDGPVPYSSGGLSILHLDGGPNDDHLTAGSGGWVMDFSSAEGNDVMIGGASSDTAGMQQGNDVADGGGGSSDFVNFQFAPPGVHFDLGLTGQQDTVVSGLDTASNFEGIVGSQLIGAPDVLIGNDGPNTINANAGDDVLTGKGGNDILNGGLGSDTASYALGSSGPVTVSLGTAAAQPTGGAGSDTLLDGSDPDTDPDIENLTGSPFGGDILTGNTNDNQIDVYDGLFDSVDCVANNTDADMAIADEIGVDALSNCETVDHAPQTSIDSGPADGTTITTRTPTYNLSADEPSDFQVSVDGGAFGACAATCTVPSLADGAHTLRFRAVDLDENGHADLTPASRAVNIPDMTPPETTVTGKAKVKTRKKKAPVTWTFTSDEPGSTFTCSLDGSPFARCTSPVTVKLRRGLHTLTVRARDAAGNADPTPASFSTKVKRKRVRR